jgi:prefoldin subunit 5
MGGVEARVQRLEEDITDLRLEIREVCQDLRAILETLARAKGGWQALVFAGSVGAAAGGFLAKFLPVLR